MSRYRSAALITLLPLLVAPSTAIALDPFENQIYDSFITPPGQFALEVHSNYTFSGRKEQKFEGELIPERALRFQLEPTYGLTEWVEIGAHIYHWVAPDSASAFGGLKLRAIFVIPPRLTTPWIFGLKAETGKISNKIKEHGWSQELRFIVGYADEHLMAILNPIVAWDIAGPDRFRLEFEPAGKLAANTHLGFFIGVEHYSGLGHFADGLDPKSEQEHLLFGVIDLTDRNGKPPPFDLNIGLGRGLTQGMDSRWIAKAIVGIGF